MKKRTEGSFLRYRKEVDCITFEKQQFFNVRRQARLAPPVM